jgi:hypothetical protein
MSRAESHTSTIAQAFHRSPAEVMRLSRLGCSHPTRLSFLRILLRRLQAEKWQFDRSVFNLNQNGVGRAVYRAIGPERTYSLVAFSHDLPADQRSDRVIATAWDATFALFDGDPAEDDLDRLEANVPVQEAGRVTSSELTLSRANRSVRLFAHVVDRLAAGEQPDADQLAATGYLMRTTAVYGSGKFGAAAYETLAGRPETSAPFQAEMLTVWLIRSFSIDLVEHLAKAKNPNAVAMSPELRRSLGVGNSTGLGMAPFLVKHPILLNNWMMVREEALARVRSQSLASKEEIEQFQLALGSAITNAEEWASVHPLQIEKLADLRQGLGELQSYVDAHWEHDGDHPWDALWLWGEKSLPPEAQEALLSLLLEPHGDLIDGLADCYSEDESLSSGIDGAMPIGSIRTLLEDNYGWALGGNYGANDECARFWYVSEDKLEPRLGERHDEPGADQELPLDIGRQADALYRAIADRPADEPIARILLQSPVLRTIVQRVQMTAKRPFAEIQENLISANLMPIDMLRCKLAVFGASRFDPRSDRWVRISLFQGAPYPAELAQAEGL